MRQPLTINELYEYRIKNIIKRVLDGVDFGAINSNEELLDLLWQQSEQFGSAVIEDMSEWTDEWLSELQESLND